MEKVRYEVDGPVAIVTIDRAEARNAIDPETADALSRAFRAFEEDDELAAAVLTGAGGTFCAGADLKALAEDSALRLAEDGDGPLGPTRMRLTKPVIAAVEGHAVAGGLELALWCDLRVAAEGAVFGVYCRRFGVPLVDLGTVRLPRIVGHGRALDMILTGRAVAGREALEMGLVSRVVIDGSALEEATALARELAALPQACMRNDRLSAYESWDLSWDDALLNEFHRGMDSIAAGDFATGAARFAAGEGRGGAPVP